MKFTAEQESISQINFLDITIHKTPTKWTTSIYRKPSFTDSIIPYPSNRPPQHKHTAITYVHNRLNTYRLQHDEFKDKLDNIHDIMRNNEFSIHTHTHTHPTPRQPTATPSQKPEITTHKWTPFTYFGRETNFITNIFKKANIRITLRTNNTFQKLLMTKPQTRDKYSRSGAYKLTCPDCNKPYVGQTEYASHRDLKNIEMQSSPAETPPTTPYMLQNTHQFGPIQETM